MGVRISFLGVFLGKDAYRGNSKQEYYVLSKVLFALGINRQRCNMQVVVGNNLPADKRRFLPSIYCGASAFAKIRIKHTCTK